MGIPSCPYVIAYRRTHESLRIYVPTVLPTVGPMVLPTIGPTVLPTGGLMDYGLWIMDYE